MLSLCRCYICLLVVAVFALIGCTSILESPPITKDPITQPNGQAPLVPDSIEHNDPPRKTLMPVPDRQLEKLTAGNVSFAMDLYRVVRGEEQNLFFSPHSLSTALAMVYAGARGETETQIRQTLHLNLEQDQLHPSIHRLNSDLNALEEPGATEGKKGFVLRVANSVWAQQNHPFLPKFLATLKEYYSQGVRFVDFSHAEPARKQINQWTGKQTSGCIPQLLKTGQLSPDTRLALINAVYFKGHWKSPFNDPTKPGKFHLADGKTVQVPLMSQRFHARIASTPEHQAVEIPYVGDHVRMLVVMPAKGGFEKFEQSLTSESLAQIRNSLSPQHTRLFLPRFEYEAELNLGNVLAKMGMPMAFNATQADFSGMDGSRRLFLTKVIHKAIVKVNEKGTEAAAATAALMEIASIPRTIRVDRPFFFCIYDTRLGNLIFMGRVIDPTKGKDN